MRARTPSSSRQPQPTIGYVVELLFGSSYSDHLLGTETADQLVGNGGGDRVEGRGGDDLVMNTWDEGSPHPARRPTTSSTAVRATTRSTPRAAPTRCSGGPVATTCARRAAPHDGRRPGRRRARALPLSRAPPGRPAATGSTRSRSPVLRRGAARRPAWGVLDHGRRLFRAGTPDGGRLRVALGSLERVTMPGSPGRWTYLGTLGDDRVRGGAAYTARGRGGDDRLDGLRRRRAARRGRPGPGPRAPWDRPVPRGDPAWMRVICGNTGAARTFGQTCT